MTANFFTIWLVLLPFIVWNGFFEAPKIQWFFAGSLLVTFFWLYRILFKKKMLVFSKADSFYLLWLLVLAISSLVGVHPFDSIVGGSYRHQGVIFFLGLWLTKKTYEALNVKERKMLYKGVGLTILSEALIVLFQVIFGKLYLGKPLGTIGEASAIAGFLAMGAYFVTTSFPKTVLVIPIISIVLTQSRSGVIAFLPNIWSFINILSKKSRTIILLLAILIVIVFVIYLSQGKGSSPFENRQVIWTLSFQQILKKPILGYGAESGEVVFNQAFSRSGFPLSGLTIDRAHNLLLDVTMWTGTVGLIAFCFWLFYSFKHLKENSKKFAFASFLIYSMLQPLSVVHWILFFLII